MGTIPKVDNLRVRSPPEFLLAKLTVAHVASQRHIKDNKIV
jgi:hypothetical protein